MPNLENYFNQSKGACRITNSGDIFDSAEVMVETSVKRDGVRRRKPVPLNPTAYDRKQYVLATPVGNGSWRSGFDNMSWSGVKSGFGGSTYSSARQCSEDVLSENVRALALLRALEPLNRRDLDLGTAWAERGKTAQLIGDIAKKSVRLLQLAKARDGRGFIDELVELQSSRNLRGGRRAIRGYNGGKVIDTYLAYQYGVKPMLQDVAGLIDALVRLPTDEWRVGSKGKSMEQGVKRTILNDFFPIRAISTYRESCRVLISAIPRPLTREQDVEWALGLDNPLGTALELTPYSFVFDWLVPIGDYLSAVNSLKYYDGWEVISSQKQIEEIIFRGASTSFAGGSGSSTCAGSFKSLRLNRSVTSGPPMFPIPVKDPRSLDHMAKGLALFASALKGGNGTRILRI